MFRQNTTHLQTSFFDIERQLSERKRKKIRESEEYSFYQLIFRKIKEENFAVLYSENGSRPNSAVNVMVSAIILAYRKGWTIKEMLEQIDFNLLTRTALGLNKMDDTAFCEATSRPASREREPPAGHCASPTRSTVTPCAVTVTGKPRLVR